MMVSLRSRPIRYSLLAACLALVVAGGMCLAACSRAAQAATTPRVIILGLDGLDDGLVSEMMAQGQLPNMTRLAHQGTFQALGTAIPPQSPVAWSDFITGMDAGGHGIFDFIHRDPATMEPYLSTSRTEAGTKSLKLGDWQFPLSGGKVELLRQGEAFWEVLQRRGVPTTVMRIPANFPPSGTAGHELSGMGTPDLLGGYGTFSFYTTNRLAFLGKALDGGAVYRLDVVDGVAHTHLVGPDNPFHTKPEKVTLDFDIHVDPDVDAVKIVIGDQERLLQAGEWSNWVPIAFHLMPTQSLPAQVLFYLRSVRPELELYVSPLNIDPESPALPISTPASFAGDLARATGRYYTQGMPENTGALANGVFTPQEFLDQARIAGDEVLNQFPYVLSHFDRGLLFYYEGNSDLVSHMMWRPMDPSHPAYDAAFDAAFSGAVRHVYEQLDELVGYTMQHMGDDTLLVVMSDHGFTSLRRLFDLNAWLHQHGYLAVKDESLPKGMDFLRNVDFSRTKAYALGLNGLYINLAGREKDGIVTPAQRDEVIAQLRRDLLATIDPETGKPAISHVYVRDQTYQDGGQRAIGPDLIVGYAKGTRSSDESAKGEVGRVVLVDNEKPWSGDHCMDAPDVPGILITSRPLKKPVSRLKNLAAAVLAEFGVDQFPVQPKGSESGS